MLVAKLLGEEGCRGWMEIIFFVGVLVKSEDFFRSSINLVRLGGCVSCFLTYG